MDRPDRDQAWDRGVRSETKTQRLERNWASLLQEMRVVQTGVQLLTGFLLTLPFQQRFGHIDGAMKAVFLVTVGSSAVSTVLLVAPVGMHRVLFRRHQLSTLVSAAHRCAYAGLMLLGVALTGVAVVVFDAVAGRLSAEIAGTVVFVLFVALWVLIPLALRRRRPHGGPAAP